MDTRAKVIAGILGLLLAVLGAWAGRTYEHRHQETLRAAEDLVRAEKEAKRTEELQLVVKQRGEAWVMIEQLKAKAWDRGHRRTNADGSVDEDWDRGTESESLQQAQRQLEEMDWQLTSVRQDLVHERMETTRLRTELTLKDEEIRKAGAFAGVLLGWDLAGGRWQERLQVQVLGSAGPVLLGASAAPVAWMDRERPVEGLEAVAGAVRPIAWAGMKF